MTLAEIYQISQTLGSAAVVASLIFVGLQIRHNTKATRAASHHAVSEALNAVNLLWARNSEVTRIWLSGLNDRNALTPEERWRFDSTVRAYLHVCETMYTQANLGAGDLGIVTAEENGIKAVFSSEGVREWWEENPFGFSPEFRDYIEGLTRPAEAAFEGKPTPLDQSRKSAFGPKRTDLCFTPPSAFEGRADMWQRPRNNTS